jgi:hypothetical protein
VISSRCSGRPAAGTDAPLAMRVCCRLASGRLGENRRGHRHPAAGRACAITVAIVTAMGARDPDPGSATMPAASFPCRTVRYLAHWRYRVLCLQGPLAASKQDFANRLGGDCRALPLGRARGHGLSARHGPVLFVWPCHRACRITRGERAGPAPILERRRGPRGAEQGRRPAGLRAQGRIPT